MLITVSSIILFRPAVIYGKLWKLWGLGWNTHTHKPTHWVHTHTTLSHALVFCYVSRGTTERPLRACWPVPSVYVSVCVCINPLGKTVCVCGDTKGSNGLEGTSSVLTGCVPWPYQLTSETHHVFLLPFRHYQFRALIPPISCSFFKSHPAGLSSIFHSVLLVM